MRISLLFALAALLLLPGSLPAREAIQLDLSTPETVSVGDPFSLRVSTEKPLPAVEVSWLGKRIRLPLSGSNGTNRGELILGTQVGENEPGTRWIGVRPGEGANPVYKRKIRVLSKDFPTQHLSLPKGSVTLSEAKLQRYRKDKRAIRAALSRKTERRYWKRPLLWPARGEITSTYGLARILNGKNRSPHTGIDMALPSGTPVSATGAGRVALAGEFLFEGKAVFLDHGGGLISMYFHLSSIRVEEGDMVKRGEIIALSGGSGRGTGAHLHFGLSALDRLVNPLPLLQEQNVAQPE